MSGLLFKPVILGALIVLVVVAAKAQNDGRYKPPPKPARRPVGDGRYRGGSDGKYRGGNDGKYVHQDVKYVHDDRPGGSYAGGSSPYTPDKNRSGPGGGGVGGSGNSGNKNAQSSGNSAGLGALGANAGGANGLGLGAGNGGSSNGAANKNNNGGAANAFGSGAGAGASAGAGGGAGGGGKPLGKGKGSGEGRNDWTIIRLEDKLEQDGYHYIYETANGIMAEEAGKIEQLQVDPGLRSKGFYEYTGDDGNLYRVDYVADDNGFVPQGSHIPPVPPHVPKLLAYLQANAANKK